MASMDGFSEKVKRLWPSQLIRDGVINMKLIVIGLLGVVLLVAGTYFDGSTKKAEELTKEPLKVSPANINRSYEEALEAKLANLLSQVKGAGAVAVSITLESGSAQEHAKNTVRESKVVQEKDNAGGVRTTTETKETEQLLVSKEGGSDRPVMVKETKPVIKGVLVIADGAVDSTVKANLTRAIEAGLGVAPYKITVLPQRK